MRAHVLQHVPFEGLGSIAPWLAARASAIGSTRFFENPPLPRLEGIELVIALGGPMSVNEETTWPWLRAEKQFLREAIDQGVAVLGICLGAQLVANALGGRVERNAQKEIGWFPIEAVAEAPHTFRFPARCSVLHWHGETFELPDRAVRLARSAACQNQAFQLGPRVMGLQFHLEMTPASVAAMIQNCGDELVPGPYVQSAAQLRAAPPAAYAETNALMGAVLDYLLRQAS